MHNIFRSMIANNARVSISNKQSVYVSEANPHLIKEYCGNSLRRVKTDETDAIKLRGMLLTTGTDLRDYTHMDTIRCLLQN